jgi:SNF2-related domain
MVAVRFPLAWILGGPAHVPAAFPHPIEKAGNMERQALLARRVAPFLLRRTKEEVAADLPPKIEITKTIEMGDGQRTIYESVRLAMHARYVRRLPNAAWHDLLIFTEVE